jgi:hypothetical protein
MTAVKLVGLMKMVLRDGRTIRLCDGGFVNANVGAGTETFLSADPTFGTIGSMETFNEGVGDEVPAFQLTFLPNSTASATEISAPGMQGSVTRFWIAELDVATDVPVEAPDLLFHGQIDTALLRTGKGKRELDISFVSTAERLFAGNEGNSLNPLFHKRVYPGELGEDNATGLGTAVAWGTEAQPGAGYGTSIPRTYSSDVLREIYR